MPGWTGFFMYSRNEKEDMDQDEIIHRRYTTDRINASLGLNYPFTKIFTVSFSVSFSNISFKNK
jgi:hypothetical protein